MAFMQGHQMSGPYWGGLWMAISILIWIIIAAGLALVVLWFFRRAGRIDRGGGGETALDVLKKRYASGEIGKEDFERIKKDIT